MGEHAEPAKQSVPSPKTSRPSTPAKAKVSPKEPTVAEPAIGRIVGVSVENEKRRILIALGRAQGVVVGMRGRIIGQHDFVIDKAIGDTAVSALIDIDPPSSFLDLVGNRRPLRSMGASCSASFCAFSRRAVSWIVLATPPSW